MKKHLSTIILIVVFFTGLSLLLYPTISDYWNTYHQSKAIATYESKVADLDNSKYEEILEEARLYNQNLTGQKNRFLLSKEEQKTYADILNITETGIMGYIEIDKIHCELPIYHGVDESVLQIAIGHIEGTSLPVGGKSTHCVISGHRGLPSAKLFTNLDQLEKGDTFVLKVLDEILTYRVDQILIVEPHQTKALEIKKGKDYCTLITCTPYGINSHRLLVRGERTDNASDLALRVPSDARQIAPRMVAIVYSIPLFILLLVWILVKYRKRY